MIQHAVPRRVGVAAAAAALLLCAAGPVRAELRFGYIDSARIFGDYKVAQEAQARWGDQAGRLRIDWVSAAEGNRFAQVVAELTDQVRQLGPWSVPLPPATGDPVGVAPDGRED